MDLSVVNQREDNKSNNLRVVCRDFMKGKCLRESCRFTHDTKLCKNWYRNFQINGKATCKFGDNCRKNHYTVHPLTQKPKNTESRDAPVCMID